MGVELDVGDGLGAEEACFFQVVFLPCLTHTKLKPLDFFTCPTFLQLVPAFTAAAVCTLDIGKMRMQIRAKKYFCTERTGEVSQGSHRETITLERLIEKLLVCLAFHD